MINVYDPIDVGVGLTGCGVGALAEEGRWLGHGEE